MKVRDIMTTHVISLHTGIDVGTAGRLMQQGGFGTMPILDRHDRVTGVLTDRDIALAAATRQRNAAHIGVHEAMTETVSSCAPDDDVAAALGQMVKHRVRRLPVVDGTSHLAGILSIDDIALRALDRDGGISSAEFVSAFQRICVPRAGENGANGSDQYVSG
jgi:CBS domain-containing protein